MVEQKFHIGVKAFIRNADGQLLISKGAPPRNWDIPGGRIEEGEGIKEALRREVAEELGIRNLEILGLYDAVIARTKVDTGKEVLGLCLLVYNCRLPEGTTLETKGNYDIHEWADNKEAAELLSNKYPKEFLDRLR